MLGRIQSVYELHEENACWLTSCMRIGIAATNRYGTWREIRRSGDRPALIPSFVERSADR
jgi:hypothetical protein